MAKKFTQSYYIIPADEYEALTTIGPAIDDWQVSMNKVLSERNKELVLELAALQRQHDERCKWSKHWREECNVLRRTAMRSDSILDRTRLDWLQENMQGYGDGWALGEGIDGRGLRLSETHDVWAENIGVYSSIRMAIDHGIARMDRDKQSLCPSRRGAT